jgi:hypothetical protein
VRHNTVHPRSVAPRHQSNGETHRTAFCVARHTERLSHLGTGLPGLSALQSLPPHSYTYGRFHDSSSPFSSHPHGSRRGHQVWEYVDVDMRKD